MSSVNDESKEMSIEVPWGVISLKCWNSINSNPVLVTHGLCENAGAFDRLIPLLSKEFFYVVVDLPGHGAPRPKRAMQWLITNIGFKEFYEQEDYLSYGLGLDRYDEFLVVFIFCFTGDDTNLGLMPVRRSSPFPKGLPLDFMNYVSQLQRIVNHFRWNKLILMGHSFGAHLLEFYAATFTKKVEKLILLDAISPTPVAKEIFLVFHRNQTKEVLQLEEKSAKFTRYTYEEALTHMSNRRMSKLSLEAAKPLLERCIEKADDGYIFTTDPRARKEIRPAIGEGAIFDQLQRIKCPVLVILAKNSEQFWLFNSPGFYTTALEILKTTNPTSVIVRVAGNHCVHNNQPEIIAPIINRFLIHQKSQI